MAAGRAPTSASQVVYLATTTTSTISSIEATLSAAPVADIIMDLTTPQRPPFTEEDGMELVTALSLSTHLARATSTASHPRRADVPELDINRAPGPPPYFHRVQPEPLSCQLHPAEADRREHRAYLCEVQHKAQLI